MSPREAGGTTVATTRYGPRSVVAAGLTTAAVLVMVVGCQRQSPRFSGQNAPTSVAQINAVTDGAGNQTVTLQMTDLLRFVPSTVNVKPGKLTVTLDNAGGDPHQFEVPVAQRQHRQHPRPHLQGGDAHDPQGRRLLSLRLRLPHVGAHGRDADRSGVLTRG